MTSNPGGTWPHAPGFYAGDRPQIVTSRFEHEDSYTLERYLATDGEDMVNRDHSCFFSAAHAAKDSGIALALAKQSKLELPLAAATFRQYRKMVAGGLGELDKSGIAELTFKGRGPKKQKAKRK